MGKLVIATNASLDGVVEDPDGKEGSGLGAWFNAAAGSDIEHWAAIESEEAMASEALLLGRRTDAWFAARWLGRPGEWAERMNTMPKYVVSSTATPASWSNASIITGDVLGQVRRLKAQARGDVVVYASYQLACHLLDHDLVDELRLFVLPVVLGSGNRLLDGCAKTASLKLVSSQAYGDLTYVVYEVLTPAPTG
ncbi:dihydrofolate reductase [Motilibacter peucedani]|uniref:Dihydrofolate reductase n=1 Tax=Motilibacter peucedani TaxID=598650 RepID=A0A420XPE0_9ACTN|nr:dihydrofolate reductase family protein [Motilibacter peucedani]RKS74070.1 dihydrofolate reductase [Motilibacter peucedani]